MLTPSAILLLTLLSAPPPLDLQPIDRLVREHVAPLAAEVKRAEEAAVQAEITVTGHVESGLVMPDYREAGVTLDGFGLIRGGSSGSPGFDTVTRQYWWE